MCDAIQLDPSNSNYRTTLATLYRERGQVHRQFNALDWAEDDLREAVRLNPTDSGNLYQLALVRGMKHSYIQMLEDTTKLVKMDPTNALYWTTHGLAYKGLYNWHDAEKVFDNSIKNNPNNGLSYSNRAFARYFQANWGGALMDLEMATKLDPKNAQYFEWLAGLRFDRDNPEGAFQAINQAIKLAPRQSNYFYRRAEINEKLGHHEDAIRDRTRAAHLTERAAAIESAKVPPPADGSGFLINDRLALDAWLEKAPRQATGDTKPVLVVVATSGGGIAAAYWTALCLSKIEDRCHDFPRQIRVITGASGGMLGAALYVARLQAPPARRSKLELDAIAEDIAKDSLTPTVRRMLLGDLPSILDRLEQSKDRGRALEDAWAHNTGDSRGLGVTYASLMQGEEKGWRPSLIITPMLVEDASFLIISNLDLANLGGGVEFFKNFRESRNIFPLTTAIRMNAAFPFVTPAVALPTKPPKRVVDAGYLDNYGVWLACTWIEHNRGWILLNTSGVALVQIRAYPTDVETRNPSFLERIWAGVQPATTPFEAVSRVRQESMTQKSEELIERQNQWFNDKITPWFFDSYILTCNSNDPAPLGWSLTAADKDGIKRALDHPSFLREVERLIARLACDGAASGSKAH